MDSPSSSPAPRRVAITGSSGLIGSAVVDRLRAEGHDVLRLVRHAPRSADEAQWDPAAGKTDAAVLEGVDAVVNLAGENVGERWTDERKRRIRDSRVVGTRALATALAGLARPPRVLVSASAVGIYGNRGDEALDETAADGGGFLAGVVREWETAAQPASAAGIRVVLPRFGVVLSARGGALAKMLTPFRLGAGGVLGSGRQWMSWISLDDAVSVIDRALHDERLAGPVNAVAGASPNAEFVHALGRVLGRPTVIPVPAFALRLAFGEMAEETILFSQRAVHRKLDEIGLRFAHPDLEGALRAAIAD